MEDFFKCSSVIDKAGVLVANFSGKESTDDMATLMQSQRGSERPLTDRGLSIL